MAQYSFVKSAGGVLIPATPEAREFIEKNAAWALCFTPTLNKHVTGSASLRDSLTQEAAFLLKQAKAVDGQEEPPEELGGYPTYESRF